MRNPFTFEPEAFAFQEIMGEEDEAARRRPPRRPRPSRSWPFVIPYPWPAPEPAFGGSGAMDVSPEPAYDEPPADVADEPLPNDAAQEFWFGEDEAFAYEFADANEYESGRGPDYNRWIQSSLNRVLGLNLLVDGVVGAKSRSAIRSFQQRSGLAADGIVGSQTERALISAGAAPPPSGSVSPPPSAGSPDIVSIPGSRIKVARSIAPQVTALLAAARAEGIQLDGGGYRSPASQIELRRKHCGPTAYDIYQKPSKECKPPTARPGRSNHEKGLAIDFANIGQFDHSNPRYLWLANNAARFGLKNLPSEAWHWSVDGN